MSDNRASACKDPGEVAVIDTAYPLQSEGRSGLSSTNLSRKVAHRAILKTVATCGSDEHMIRGSTTARRIGREPVIEPPQAG